MKAFKPYQYAPVSQALDGSSHALALPIPSRSNDVIRVVVSGTAVAAIKAGASTITASSTVDMLLLANSVELFTLDDGVTHIAVNGASGSTVQITMGTGI